MELLQSLLDNTSTPLLYAFILGLMTAISPCPLATNITAIAYISKDIENKRKIFTNGLIYTLGRAISYTFLGLLLFFGASKFQISKIFTGSGEKCLGFLLIVIGIFMLDIININFPTFSKLTQKVQNQGFANNSLRALLLGMVFALAFCPYSAVLYFGMLIPITITSISGLYLPAIFALATGLPVIVIAYLLAFSVSSVGNFYKKIQVFQRGFNRVVAIVFMVVGLYYVYLFYLK